ncbi:MAG TPA: transcriptional regulator [Naasia sp.]
MTMEQDERARLLAEGWTPPGQVPRLLTLDEVAARYGWTIATARQYRASGVLPPPDAVFGRTPVWLPATLDVWERDRPGQGAGGGRPSR